MFLGLRNESGFSLVEVIAAILIFMVAIIGVTVVFSGGAQPITQAKVRDEAKAYATQLMDSIKRLPFYVAYDGSNNKDIDDFYYIPTDAGGSKANTDQLNLPFSTSSSYYPMDKDYGSIPGHSDLKQMIRVQYQSIDAGTQQLASPPPTMKTGWGPKTIGNDEPYDNAGTPARLRLLLIRVTVYYRYNGKEASVTLDSIVSDSAAVFYPRVDSVSPNGVEQGTNVTLTITGQGFSTSAAPTVLLTKANHSDITCTVTDHSLSTRIICTTGTLPSSGMIGSGETAYWNVKVINTDSMSSSLLNGIYVIQNSPFIYTMDPTGGVVGSWAKVSGQDFGVKRDANDKVTFQGSSGRIDVATYGDGTSGHTVWSNNIIWVTVPVGAITGNVMVLKGSLSSNTYLFTVGGATQPNITSVNNSEPGRSGASGDVGNTVRIAGTNFGAAGATSSVTFYNGRTVASTSCNLWTATLIEVVVPSGATTGNLYVTAGGVNSNNVTFSVPYSGP